MKKGYTKSWRKHLASDVWEMPPLYNRIWYWLRQNAVWEHDLFPTVRKYGIWLAPGQLCTSINAIAEGVAWREYGVRRVPNKKTVKAVLDWLVFHKMVTVESNAKGTWICIVNWDTYNVSIVEKVTVESNDECPQNKRSVPTPKEVLRSNKKKKKKTYVETSDEFRLSKLLLDLIRKRNPGHAQPNLQDWAKHIDILTGKQKRPAALIEQVIRWSQESDFWQNNILSTNKLKIQFDQLVLKMKQKPVGNANKPRDTSTGQVPYFMQEGKDE